MQLPIIPEPFLYTILGVIFATGICGGVLTVLILQWVF